MLLCHRSLNEPIIRRQMYEEELEQPPDVTSVWYV